MTRNSTKLPAFDKEMQDGRTKVQKKREWDALAQDEDSSLPDLDTHEWNDLQECFSILHPRDNTIKDNGLTRRQKLVAYAMSLGWPQSKVAEQTNIHRNTIGRWLKDDNFNKFLKACDYVNGVAKANEFIKDRIIVITKVIDELATNPSVENTVRLQAAKTIFNQALGDPKQTHEIVTLRDVYDRISSNPAVTPPITFKSSTKTQ
jgi:hypothetical protein